VDKQTHRHTHTESVSSHLATLRSGVSLTMSSESTRCWSNCCCKWCLSYSNWYVCQSHHSDSWLIDWLSMVLRLHQHNI